MADPTRNAFVMVGDASYLMMSQESVTAVQERLKLTILLVDNHGLASIGAPTQSVVWARFGSDYRARGDGGRLSCDVLPIDFVANAASLGAHAVRAGTVAELRQALDQAQPRAGVS